MNEYFTLMVEHITREEGMLDKFIGDAIMATKGVSLPTGTAKHTTIWGTSLHNSPSGKNPETTSCFLI